MLVEVLRRHGWIGDKFVYVPCVPALIADLEYVKCEEGNYNTGIGWA